MRRKEELEQMFKKILGTDWISVIVHGEHISVLAREVDGLDSETLEDIEANGFFIEQWSFDIAGGGTFMAHLIKEVDEE